MSRLSASTRPIVETLETRQLFNAPGWANVIDNPNMPFITGMRWVYKGVKDGVAEKNIVVVQKTTKLIIGVTCTVVHDTVFEKGKLVEKTDDWYAQDSFGNVWYFGEDTAEYVNGKIDNTDGTWQSGVNGAKPGIVMEADPVVGDAYQQEFAAPVARDQASVLNLSSKAVTPFGTFNNCLKTQESSPLEPGAAEVKFYQKGIGFIRSQTISGPEKEILKLVSFTP